MIKDLTKEKSKYGAKKYAWRNDSWGKKRVHKLTREISGQFGDFFMMVFFETPCGETIAVKNPNWTKSDEMPEEKHKLCPACFD